MTFKALFIAAVRATRSLPDLLREHAEHATAVEEHRFDESYIEFLDAQIRFSPRGPEWTAQLIRRRAALLPYCRVTLLRGSLQVGDTCFTAEVHPERKAVVHWEQYEYQHAG
jgi:hypothetical protein